MRARDTPQRLASARRLCYGGAMATLRERIPVYLPADEAAAIKRLATRQHRSASELLRHLGVTAAREAGVLTREGE